MARRKRYPKLPNGYGSIKKLSGSRRNPFAVHPPTTEFSENGSPVTPTALCYTDSWIKGFTILTAYKAGTYYPGMEKDLEDEEIDTATEKSLVKSLLASYNRIALADNKLAGSRKTFKEVYEEFFDYKYIKDQSRTYAKGTIKNTKSAFKNWAPLHDRIFSELRHDDLQQVLDACKLKHSSHENMKNTIRLMYDYAMLYEIVDKDYSAKLKINIPDDDEHGVPFSDQELAVLWKNQDNPCIEMILIMCYSGFRVSAYKTMEINLGENYFKGGVKTTKSKDRIVPIHSAIIPLVKRRTERDGKLMGSDQTFRKQMTAQMARLGFEHHTPHDCRHTFSKLCEDFQVRENDRKRMLGHAFQDLTNAVYGHRDLEDLRNEIEKINPPAEAENICH